MNVWCRVIPKLEFPNPGILYTVETYKTLYGKSLRFFADVQIVMIFSVAFLNLDLVFESYFWSISTQNV